jgi:hypothetical protein
MGQFLPTRNPLFLVPFGYGLGTMMVQVFERFGPRGYEPWEFRYRDAITEGRIPSHVTLDEFREKYDDYRTTYNPDPKHE